MREIAVFSGSAHRALAQSICDRLDTPLHGVDVRKFSNDCIQVQLLDTCRERDVFFVQPLCAPVQENLMELLQMMDAARGSAASRITAVIPYYAYARSDKKDEPRISITARLVADLLVTAGANRVITMTLHSSQVHGFFGCPVDHLNAIHTLADHVLDAGLVNDHTVVASPDLGNAKNAAKFAKLLNVPVVAGNKRRISDTEVEIDIVGDVNGKDVIVTDDEIATGGTMIELIERMKESGARRVHITATHGLFTSTALEKLAANPHVEQIISTDTVPLRVENPPSKLHVVSVAPLIAEAIRRTHNGESISALFER
jgi:ribose-phosphate pyrophosphokinase